MTIEAITWDAQMKTLDEIKLANLKAEKELAIASHHIMRLKWIELEIKKLEDKMKENK